MASIQSAINSMIGSASHAVIAVRGYQELRAKQAAKAEKAAQKSITKREQPQAKSVQEMAASRAKQSAENAIKAKSKQRRNFMEYLAKQDSSLGKIGNLDPAIQNKIAQQYTPHMRKQLMDAMDAAGKGGGKKWQA